MRIAFYAPLKAPNHPVASGDRTMARSFVQALSHAGHEVSLASRLRTFDAKGDPARQVRLRHLGQKIAESVFGEFVKVSAAELNSVDDVKALWQQHRGGSPTVLFIDHADQMFPNPDGGQGTGASRETLLAWLISNFSVTPSCSSPGLYE